jgi:hypothetical protein
MSELSISADVVSPPGSGGTITVPSGSSNTSATSLVAYQGAWLWLKSTAKTHVNFGTSTVATALTTHIYLTADVDYFFRIPKDGSLSYIKTRGATTGTLYYRKTSGPL